MSEANFRKLVWKIIKICALIALISVVSFAVIHYISSINIPCKTEICIPEGTPAYPTILKISQALRHIYIIPILPVVIIFDSLIGNPTGIFYTYIVVFIAYLIELIALGYLVIFIGKIYFYLRDGNKSTPQGTI